jgi:hypothetical protein
VENARGVGKDAETSKQTRLDNDRRDALRQFPTRQRKADAQGATSIVRNIAAFLKAFLVYFANFFKIFIETMRFLPFLSASDDKIVSKRCNSTPTRQIERRRAKRTSEATDKRKE